MPYSDPEKLKAYNKRKYARIKNSPELRKKANAYAREQRRRRPDLARNRQLKHMFGITLEQFDQMVLEQKNCCAICGRGFTTTPHVDHDHETLKVRKLLCLACNTGLGNFKDNLIFLNKAIDYLKEYGKA